MGSPLQEILQGRDNKKGSGIGVKRALLPSFLLLSYAGLIFNLPATKTLLWFTFTVALSIVYSYICFIRQTKEYSFETLAFFALLLAGVIQFLNYNWLHIIYMPYLIALSMFYSQRMILKLSLTVPVLEVRHFMSGDVAEEISFSVMTILIAVVTSITISRLRKQRDRVKASLETIKKEAENFDYGVGMDIISDDSIASQHISSTLRANEEIKDLLSIVRQLLATDSAGVFVLQGDQLQLRCSADETGNPCAYDTGLLTSCFRKREPVISNFPSLIATPVMDGNIAVGILAACSAKPKTFKGSDLKILEMFTHQMVMVFQRERINTQINRVHSGLKVLHEGSAKLITSLNMEVIAKRLIDALYKVAPLSIALLIPKGDRYELFQYSGLVPPDERVFDISNTLVGMLQKNRENVYLSDLRDNRRPVLPFRLVFAKKDATGTDKDNRISVLPFKADQAGSIFILPLIYEKELLGVIVFLSEKVNALSPYQIELLEVLGYQAATSIANARLYSEIERMSITDGLTGLFNHRHFQDKLSSEFRRLQRFPETFSLLLIDIDFFKKVNDAYGHPAGDEVLRGVATIIRETIRDIDIPARYGGEEFAAILLKTGSDGAKKMAERLRKSVTEKAFSIDGKNLKVTVSIGIATSPADASNKEDLIERADHALYYAKKNGRNRSVLYKEIN